MKEELIARYVDDRESLSDLELQELMEVMEGNPALCRDLRALVCMDDLLSRTLCVERQNFRVQVAQRILDERQGEPARQERRKRLLVDVRLLKEDRNAVEGQAVLRRRPSWPVFLPWTAAASVAVALGLWWVWHGARGEGAGQESIVAKAGTVTGAVSVRGANGTTRVLGAGAEIGPGDRVLTGTNGEVELTWKDGTRITAREDTEFGFADCRLPDGGYRKALDLTRGGFAASVAKQPKDRPLTVGTPHALCTVTGTKFFLLVAQATNTFTRMDVTEGAVEFSPSAIVNRQSRMFLVSAGQAVSSGPNVPATVIRSFGRELSARHGGVVYRDYGQVCDLHRGFAIDNVVLKPSGRPLVASCREFLDMLDARNRQDVRMEKQNVDNRDRDVLVIEGRDAMKQVSVRPPEDMRHWMARIDLEWETDGEVAEMFAPLLMTNVADPPAHGLPRAWKSDRNIAGKGTRFQIESRAVRIGETPAGAPIYEVETLFFGQRHIIEWRVGRFCFGAQASNSRLRVLDMRVEPLDVVSP